MSNTSRFIFGPSKVTHRVIESLSRGPLARRINIVRERENEQVTMYLIYGETVHVESFKELVESLVRLEIELGYPTHSTLNPQYGY